MSVASVFRVRFGLSSVVVKTSPRPAESLFYERVAPRLREGGVPIQRDALTKAGCDRILTNTMSRPRRTRPA